MWQTSGQLSNWVPDPLCQSSAPMWQCSSVPMQQCCAGPVGDFRRLKFCASASITLAEPMS
eukprot:673503-Rhodomonas_salina.1